MLTVWFNCRSLHVILKCSTGFKLPPLTVEVCGAEPFGFVSSNDLRAARDRHMTLLSKRLATQTENFRRLVSADDPDVAMRSRIVRRDSDVSRVRGGGVHFLAVSRRCTNALHFSFNTFLRRARFSTRTTGTPLMLCFRVNLTLQQTTCSVTVCLCLTPQP